MPPMPPLEPPLELVPPLELLLEEVTPPLEDALTGLTTADPLRRGSSRQAMRSRAASPPELDPLWLTVGLVLGRVRSHAVRPEGLLTS